MSQNPFLPRPAPIDRKAIVSATPGVEGGARWFWWIAGLSLVNTVMIHSGSETSFMIGLGFTLIADVALKGIPALAFAIDAVAIGFFVAMGWLALRGHVWAFAVGGAVYLLDALIFLYFQDFFPLALHGLALFYIVSGALALHRALKAARNAPATAPAATA